MALQLANQQASHLGITDLLLLFVPSTDL